MKCRIHTRSWYYFVNLFDAILGSYFPRLLLVLLQIDVLVLACVPLLALPGRLGPRALRLWWSYLERPLMI